jgi:hypothetical protein
MFGSVILEVVIGLAFIYFLVSLVCSAVVEVIGSLMDRRGKTLESSLKLILGDKASEILTHPLVNSLTPNKTKPSHIDPAQFVSVIVNEVTKAKTAAPAGEQNLDTLKRLFPLTKPDKSLAQAPIVKVLETLLGEVGGDLDKLRLRLKEWFEQEMDQLSAWYKRHTIIGLLAAAAILTFSLNVDTIALTKTLFRNPAQREKLANLALERIKLEQPPSPADPLESTKKALSDYLNVVSSAEIQLGKPFPLPTDPSDIASRILGYLLTIAAVSLGAPFWFDLLGKLVNLRLAAKPEQGGNKKT